MKKLGLITIGQSPRTDVLPDIEPIFGREIELHHAGALDGLTKEEIAAFAPQDGDYVLISRLRDGSHAVFAERCILPRLQACIDRLESEGVSMILFLCTGAFPGFRSRVPLYFPCRILNGAVPALAPRARIAVVTPKAEQLEQTAEKWKGFVEYAEVVVASPYGEPSELDDAADKVSKLDVDLAVLDCIGYTVEMKRRFRARSGKPVVLSRTIAARTIMELLTD